MNKKKSDESKLVKQCHKHAIEIHEHHKQDKWKLIAMILLNILVCLAEYIGSKFTKSLTLGSDAVHMLSDIIGLFVGLVANILSGKEKSASRTFGWYRAETLGGFANGIFLMSLCLHIIHETFERFVEPVKIEDFPSFFFIGTVGLVVNLLGLLIFHNHGHSDSIEGVFLHIMSDTLGSVAVMVSIFMQYYYEDKDFIVYVEPGLNVAFIFLIFINAWKLVKRTGNELLEKAPRKTSITQIQNEISNIDAVKHVFSIHAWQIGKQIRMATIQVVIDKASNKKIVMDTIKQILLKDNFYCPVIHIESADEHPSVDPDDPAIFGCSKEDVLF